MSRKIIEFHNSDKYQPYFHAPLVDRIEGDAEEIILSADGRDTSASGNTVGSLSMNVSGGVWTDYGAFSTQQFGVSGTITTSTANNTLFTFDSNTYKACFVELLFTKSTGAVAVERATIAVDGATPTVDRTVATQPDYYVWNVVNSSGTCTVQINQALSGDTYKAVVKLL